MDLKPANKDKGPTYDPQGSGQRHDSLFSELCPGTANSGILAHKWSASGDHTQREKPPEGLKGD